MVVVQTADSPPVLKRFYFITTNQICNVRQIVNWKHSENIKIIKKETEQHLNKKYNERCIFENKKLRRKNLIDFS